MAKLVTPALTTLTPESTAVSLINSNFDAADTAMENTLSRDGTSPNSMEADLDMNSNQILNLTAATVSTEPIRKAEFDVLEAATTGVAAAAAASAAAAATSETNASTSETNAGTSETNASTSETNAASSASAASTSETNAATSETNAAASAVDAAVFAGLRFAFDSGTSDADPGSGELRFDNATLSSITNLYISDLDDVGVDVSSIIDTWDDSTSTNKGIIRVREANTPTNFFQARISGAVTDAVNYKKVPLQYLASNGSFSATDTLALEFYANGDAGSGGGDVTGPASSTDNTLPRYDSTTGKLLQTSGVVVDDTDSVSGVGTLATGGSISVNMPTVSTGLSVKLDDTVSGSAWNAILIDGEDNTANESRIVGSWQSLDPGASPALAFAFTSVTEGDTILYAADADAMVEHLRCDGSAGEVVFGVPTVNATQPSFSAYNSVTDFNVTGDGTTATVDFDTEIFDLANNFTGDTFTAPITGKYYLSAHVRGTGFDASMDQIEMRIETTLRDYLSILVRTNDLPSHHSSSRSVIADMDAGDTATVTYRVAGSGLTADIFGGTLNTTHFSGRFLG